MGVVAALAQVPTTSASFTSATGNESDFAAASSFCTSPGSSSAAVANDTMVVESAPGTNYGGEVILQVRARVGDARRVLVRPVLPTIPAGCSLLSARITFTVRSFQAGRTYEVQRAASGWDVFGVTWSSQPAGTGSATASTTTNGTFSVWVTEQVRALLAGPNHGLILRDQAEETPATFTNGYSSIDDGSPAVVAYTWG